eukprot:7253669-Prymnesium_polylepis.1
MPCLLDRFLTALAARADRVVGAPPRRGCPVRRDGPDGVAARQTEQAARPAVPTCRAADLHRYPRVARGVGNRFGHPPRCVRAAWGARTDKYALGWAGCVRLGTDVGCPPRCAAWVRCVGARTVKCAPTLLGTPNR